MKALNDLGGTIFWGGIITVIGVATPLVSLVAIPIFAIKSIPKFIDHKKLYNKTLTNGTRAKFGRVEGQDYTRWDGKKTFTKKNDFEKEHERINIYFHGGTKNYYNNELPQDYPFKTIEDLNWLKREFKRREKKDLLDDNLTTIKAFSWALIPLVGIFVAIVVKLNECRISDCNVCKSCCMAYEEEPLEEKKPKEEIPHWKWHQAIKFHIKTVKENLGINENS